MGRMIDFDDFKNASKAGESKQNLKPAELISQLEQRIAQLQEEIDELNRSIDELRQGGDAASPGTPAGMEDEAIAPTTPAAPDGDAAVSTHPADRTDEAIAPVSADGAEEEDASFRDFLLFMMDKMTPRNEVIKLHLELMPEGNPIWENECDEAEHTKLLDLAKAEKGISRDILAPGDMTLHALHYATTKLFGWMNEHLHRFCLTDDTFEAITEGCIGGYYEQVGILFRAHSEDTADLSWDDDYEDGSNFDRWRRRKYTRPFMNYALTDTWYEASRDAAGMREQYSELPDDDRIDAAGDGHFRYEICKDLMESLTLEDIFTISEANGKAVSLPVSWREALAHQAEELPEWLQFLENEKGPDGTFSYEELADQLHETRAALQMLESGIYRDHALKSKDFHKQIKRQTRQSAEKVLSDCRADEETLKRACLALFDLLKVRPEPFTQTLLYNYDFGDDWWIRITAEEIYTLDDESDEIFYDHRGALPDEETGDLLKKVLNSGRPICVASDGLNLVEDVGGISGYMDFLETLRRGPQQEKDEMRTWAKGLGWTGRKKKPENML